MRQVFTTPGRGGRETGPVLEDVRTHSDTVSKAWMITFSDLISLLLTFFVMLFAMSNVKLDAWNEVTDTLSRSLDPKPVEEDDPTSADFNVASIVFEAGTSIGYLASVLEELLARDELLSTSYLVELEDRLIVSVPGGEMFDTGGAGLTQQAREAVFKLSGVVRNIENRLAVEAHTGAEIAPSAAYASRWELTVARAAAVANLLRKFGVRQQIEAVGYADSRSGAVHGIGDGERPVIAERVDLIIYPGIGRRSP